MNVNKKVQIPPDTNISIKKTSKETNLSGSRKRILSPFTGRKKRKAWNNIWQKKKTKFS